MPSTCRSSTICDACREAHQVVGIGQRIGFVEVIHTPRESTLGITPRSIAPDVEVAHRQDRGSTAEFSTEHWPVLSPPIVGAAKERKRIAAYGGMFGAQVRLDNGRAPAHPRVVSTRRFMNVHRHDLVLGEATLLHALILRVS